METIFNPAKIITPKVTIEDDGIDLFRHAYARLELYGDEQTKLYGYKETLVNRLQYRHGIQLGKNIRKLCGDIILFFPTKTGLSGKLGLCEWDVFSGDFCPFSGLISFQPCIEAPNYDRFLRSLGFGEDGKLLSGLNPLYLYQHGQLYVARSVNLVGTIHLEWIPGRPNKEIANI